MSDALLTATVAPAEVAPAVDAKQAPATEATSGNAVESAIGKWVEQAKPEHRGYEFLKGKEKIDDLILYTKSREEELAKLSEEVAKIPKKPGADAKPEEIAKWKADNGYAVKPEDYVFKKDGPLASIPENKEIDDFYRSTFLEIDLPKDKAEALYAKVALKGKELMEKAVAARAEERKVAENAMRQAYKTDYDANMKTITEFGKANFQPETWKIIEASGLGNRLDFADFLATMGKEFGTGRFVKGASSGQTSESSAADILFPSMKRSS